MIAVFMFIIVNNTLCYNNERFYYEGESIYKSQMSVSLISFVHYAFIVCQQMVVSDRLGTRAVSASKSTMAGVLHECAQVEQRVVVHFLWAKGLSTEEVNAS